MLVVSSYKTTTTNHKQLTNKQIKDYEFLLRYL